MRTFPAKSVGAGGRVKRPGWRGGRLRTLSRQLRSADHVHAGRAWRRDDDCWNLGSIQPARGAVGPSLDLCSHATRRSDRILFSPSRHSAQTGGWRLPIVNIIMGPPIFAPLLIGAAAGAMRSPKAARTWLPSMSALAIIDGGVGFLYHARGVLRRPGGMKKPLYNIVYGPPIFAPLLFAACGTIGLLASLMRRER